MPASIDCPLVCIMRLGVHQLLCALDVVTVYPVKQTALQSAVCVHLCTQTTPPLAPHLPAAPPHRYYEILTDPRPPRHSGHRAATLRTICSELLKVCNHPHLLPDFAPEEEAAGVAPVVAGASPMAMLLSASGKLQLLDRVLGLLKVHGQVRDWLA